MRVIRAEQSGSGLVDRDKLPVASPFSTAEKVTSRQARGKRTCNKSPAAASRHNHRPPDARAILLVHQAALELQAEGEHVLLIGQSAQLELQRLRHDLNSYDVIGGVGEVQCYQSQWLGIVCQPHMPAATTANICTYIQLYNPQADIRLIDTACPPGRRRRQAMLALINRVDAIVVLDGRPCNEAQDLVALCEQQLTPAQQIGSADQLDPQWFADVDSVGLIVATSTEHETINEVQRALLRIVRQRQTQREP